MQTITRALAAAVLAAVLSSCGGTRGPEAGPMPGPTTLVVENRNWSAMTIYAVRSGQRIRLGTVQAVSTQTLRIPDSLVSGPVSLSFIADPIGSDAAPTSQEIFVRPGDRVRLFISN